MTQSVSIQINPLRFSNRPTSDFGVAHVFAGQSVVLTARLSFPATPRRTYFAAHNRTLSASSGHFIPCSASALTRATRLSEGPQTAASRFVVRPERYTQKL